MKYAKIKEQTLELWRIDMIMRCLYFSITAVSTIARSATATADYASALSGTADFEATDDTEATVMLTIMNDMNIESTEQLELTLTVPAGDGVVGEVSKAVVNILDDDAPSMFIQFYYLSQNYKGHSECIEIMLLI